MEKRGKVGMGRMNADLTETLQGIRMYQPDAAVYWNGSRDASGIPPGRSTRRCGRPLFTIVRSTICDIPVGVGSSTRASILGRSWTSCDIKARR